MDHKHFTALLNEMEASSRNNGVESKESCSSCHSTHWKVFTAVVDCLVQTLIGGSVFVTLWFAFKSTPFTAFQLHVGFCVVGYQLFIAHGIISLHSSSWSFLGIQHRRRVHLVLQITGSVFAIAGSLIMMREKAMQFRTVHSKLALAALILTSLSLINGLTSLYALELRRIIPPKVSRISHIALGTSAFALSSVSLAFGFNKKTFKKWATDDMTYIITGVVLISSIVIIIPPWNKNFQVIYR